MSSYKKGDYVRAVSGGSGRRVRDYYNYSFYQAGEELIITSVTSTHLNVRKANNKGPVFRIDYQKVERFGRGLGVVPEGSMAADDPRIAWLFEDAQRLADRLGLCNDFDRIAEALGVPGRVRNFSLKLTVSEGIEITAKVEARSKKLAEQMVLERFSGTAVQPKLRAITVI